MPLVTPCHTAPTGVMRRTPAGSRPEQRRPVTEALRTDAGSPASDKRLTSMPRTDHDSIN
ncbi:hypothetical protein GCM10010392_07700 [Streptomyces clavifer]|nr:hypothetical protein GCM10010392_07700 [Streptomyces clavifer]